MFQRFSGYFSIERLGIALFAGALTLIAATMAFARPMEIDRPYEKEPSAPVIMNMTCSEAIERTDKSFKAKFIVYLTPHQVSDGGVVTSDSIGTCAADTGSTNYNALAGTIDIHSFVTGGNSCKEADGSVSFSVFHDRRKGFGRSATLTIKNVNYNCEL